MSDTQARGESDDQPVRCCVICGAVITEATTEMHNQWHDRLDKRMNAADSGIGFMGSMFSDPEKRL